jgi:tryptophan synthase beta chain
VRRRRLQRDRALSQAFLDDEDVAIWGFEPAATAVETGRHRSRPSSPGDRRRLHGARTYVLQDEDGQTIESALDLGRPRLPRRRPAARPPRATGRATYLPVTDAEAMDALALLSRTEGIIPAIESAHAVAGALVRRWPREGPEATC